MADDIQKLGVTGTGGGSAAGSGFQLSDTSFTFDELIAGVQNWDGRLNPFRDGTPVTNPLIGASPEQIQAAFANTRQYRADQVAQVNALVKAGMIPQSVASAILNRGALLDQYGNPISGSGWYDAPLVNTPPAATPAPAPGSFLPPTPAASSSVTPTSSSTATPAPAPAAYTPPAAIAVNPASTQGVRLMPGQRANAVAVTPGFAPPANPNNTQAVRSVIPTEAARNLPDAPIEMLPRDTVATVSPTPAPVAVTDSDKDSDDLDLPASVTVLGATADILTNDQDASGLFDDSIFGGDELTEGFEQDLEALPAKDTDMPFDSDLEDANNTPSRTFDGSLDGLGDTVKDFINDAKEIKEGFDDLVGGDKKETTTTSINPMYIVGGIVVLYLLLRRK